MRLHLIILLAILLVVGCSQNRKPKADPSIPPAFVKQKRTFESNAQLFFGTPDRKLKLSMLDVMHLRVADNTRLADICSTIGPGQAIIAEYDSELRRTLSMADVEQSLDLMFVNSAKMIVGTITTLQAYSTEKFTSFEYAQYIIVSPAGFCAENNIAEGDFIDFGQRKKISLSDSAMARPGYQTER